MFHFRNKKTTPEEGGHHLHQQQQHAASKNKKQQPATVKKKDKKADDKKVAFSAPAPAPVASMATSSATTMTRMSVGMNSAAPTEANRTPSSDAGHHARFLSVPTLSMPSGTSGSARPTTTSAGQILSAAYNPRNNVPIVRAPTPRAPTPALLRGPPMKAARAGTGCRGGTCILKLWRRCSHDQVIRPHAVTIIRIDGGVFERGGGFEVGGEPLGIVPDAGALLRGLRRDAAHVVVFIADAGRQSR